MTDKFPQHYPYPPLGLEGPPVPVDEPVHEDFDTKRPPKLSKGERIRRRLAFRWWDTNADKEAK